MQKKRDEMAEQMRVYQAEIQDKRLIEIELKKLKQQVASKDERISDLTKQLDVTKDTNDLLESSFKEMMQAREKVLVQGTRELEEVIDCMTSVTRMVQKGEKVQPVFLRERVKDDTLRKMKGFLDLNKVKL